MHLEEIPMVALSLDRRPDRWAAFQRYAHDAGLDVKKISAVDGKIINAVTHPLVSLGTAHNIKFKHRRSHYEIDAAGAIGCTLSHVRAWEQLVKSGAPAMVVFEDDAPIPSDFKTRLELILPQLPVGWDIIQFQLTYWENGDTGCKPIVGQEPWQLCTALMGSYAYMISRDGASKMLARAFPIELHMDAYMAYMSKMDHIRMLWHPLIDIPGPAPDSDIMHGRQGVLGVPTDLHAEGMVALRERSVWGLVTMAAVVGGLVALAYVIPLHRH